VTALAYRRATGDDLHFVEESFLDSFRTCHTAGLISMDEWHDVMAPQWRRLMARPRMEVAVAYHPGETDHRADLYGWLAVERGHERPYVLYCYVKQPYRRMGVARGLFAYAGIDGDLFDFAANTGAVSRVRPKIPRARFRPLIARFPPP
jgi:GNAT superfamily N-acetyltransferase